MFLQGQIGRIKDTYNEYPEHFWILIGARFIDALGGALIFPFLTLYVTSKFDIGMTQVGLLFGVYSIASIVGSALGGALTDRFGRKRIVILGLVTSALSSLVMGVTEEIQLFFGAALFVGLFANVGGPASQAMIVDMVPEAKRAQGFGISRVMHNLAVTIGPAIGGLLAARSYLSLFILDAISSLITAGLVYFLLPETMPKTTTHQPSKSTLESFQGYGKVLRDSKFMLFLLANTLMVLVYLQMNGTLAVYLRDFHGVPAQGFGYIMSLNAGMVVLFQFALTRRIEKRPPFLIMAMGTVLYVVGFGMYGIVSVYSLFLVAMAIITVGEMLTAPVGQAITAQMAPEDMRGRYMAFYAFSWTIPMAGGFYLAGLILDNLDPRLVWLGAGLVGIIATGVFLMMYFREKGMVPTRISSFEEAIVDASEPKPIAAETL